eukprot:scaffold673498_cov61-Prasinocladus_malaysianus.AAC.1
MEGCKYSSILSISPSRPRSQAKLPYVSMNRLFRTNGRAAQSCITTQISPVSSFYACVIHYMHGR